MARVSAGAASRKRSQALSVEEEAVSQVAAEEEEEQSKQKVQAETLPRLPHIDAAP